MTEEKQLELVKKYPKILKDFRGDMRATCMAWGIETDDGYYDLLDKCMGKMQHYCNLASTQGESVQVVADQIKEKYGTLRFYWHLEGGTRLDSDIIDDIATEAERESAHTCEISGERGSLCVKWGWYKTLSYAEARKNGYKASNPETEEYWAIKDNEHNKLCSTTQANSAVG